MHRICSLKNRRLESSEGGSSVVYTDSATNILDPLEKGGKGQAVAGSGVAATELCHCTPAERSCAASQGTATPCD